MNTDNDSLHIGRPAALDIPLPYSTDRVPRFAVCGAMVSAAVELEPHRRHQLGRACYAPCSRWQCNQLGDDAAAGCQSIRTVSPCQLVRIDQVSVAREDLVPLQLSCAPEYGV
jgi:hypothetical protein